MPANRWTPAGRQGSVPRVATHVLVIGIHLGAWWLFFGGGVPPWRLPSPRADHRLDSLRIRLIPTRSPPLAHTPPPAPPMPPERAILRTPKAVPSTHVTRSTAAHSPAIAATPPVASTGDYISGGNLLRGSNQDFPPAVHLPGSGTPVVRGFHMTDPRMQGIGGVARKLQHLFGIPDRHCMDVDAWRGMTVQEQLARHISQAQVERTAKEYHCFAYLRDPWLP